MRVASYRYWPLTTKNMSASKCSNPTSAKTLAIVVLPLPGKPRIRTSSPEAYERASRDSGPKKGVFPCEVWGADWARTDLNVDIWILISELKVSSKAPLFIFWFQQLRGSRFNLRMFTNCVRLAYA